MPRPERRELLLRSARALSPTVRELGFRTADGEAFDYVAGQWLTLYVATDEGELQRSYSIAASPDPVEPDRVELAVTFVEGGPASGALHAMSLGTRVDAGGPLGFFTLDGVPPEAPVVLVGTGTGVAPLRAMLQAELRRSPVEGPPITLLFGCRTPEDILYREELEALAAAHERFHYASTLSRAAGDWPGRTGYVQTHLGEHCAGPESHVFICGLSKMVKDVRRLLKADFGYDRSRIHTERYD
ncbi:MAG: FAD-dependent oxidoreductase [Deltaproteobacteria bacterium]|nr:FAD-dependent oxidoreductase [Deltaproteobacteria bacterium]